MIKQASAVLRGAFIAVSKKYLLHSIERQQVSYTLYVLCGKKCLTHSIVFYSVSKVSGASGDLVLKQASAARF